MQKRFKNFIQQDYPQLEINSFKLLGEGWDNIAFEVNNDLVFRFCKKPENHTIRNEVELQTLLQNISPLPVPMPSYFSEKHGYTGYKKLVGQPLLSVIDEFNLQKYPQLPRKIGAFLTVINNLSTETVKDYIGEDHDSLENWRTDAGQYFAKVRHIIPRQHIENIKAFLQKPLPIENYQPCFGHNDLGAEHILIDIKSGDITGIIDWTDAAIADPAYDLGLLYRDLGETTLDKILTSYHSDVNDINTIRERAIFYGRCTVFANMDYGLHTKREEYIQKGLRVLNHMFGKR